MTTKITKLPSNNNSKIKMSEQEKLSKISKKNILKKFSFLIVIIIAGLVHLLIKKIGFDSSIETAAIFILWAVSILTASFCALYSFDKKYREKCDTFGKAELDVISYNENPTEKRIYLERSGKSALASVEGVDIHRMASSGGGFVIFVVKYCFCDKNNRTFSGIKQFYDSTYNFVPSVPKSNDKIKILYDESNPNDSIIVHEKADKVKWYQLQKKYKIKIITNTKN